MTRSDDRGYAMAALLVAMSVMGIMLGVALPVWRTMVQRERETELIFRGEQYAQAIDLFSRRNGGFPPSLDVLRTGRYIRKLYKDPVTDEGDFRPVYLGQVVPGVPVVPGQAGRGVRGGAAGARAGAPPQGGPAVQPLGQRGQARGGPLGQPGQPGQPGATGAGPIIGVVSASTAQALRLYNGRGYYNEWVFVATAATRQPTAPVGAGAPGARGTATPGPGGRDGRAGGRAGPQGPGRAGPGAGVPPPPSRGPAQGSPFGRPGGLPPAGGQGQRGRL